MEYPVLRHSLDKVRYFRNVLYGNDMKIRIIVGDQASKKMTALRRAVEDVEMGPHRANQLCVLTPTNPVPWLAVKEPKDGTAAILVYLRWSLPERLLDPFVEALLAEYGEENCEVVIFESDPTLG
jgi:hypothetical protein